MVNYGIAYGLSAYGLADRLNIEQEEAASYIERYFERFPTVKRQHRGDDRVRPRERLREDAARPPPADPGAPRASPQVRSQVSASRSTCRSRGTSADIIKIAMVRQHKAPGVRSRDPPRPPDPRRAPLRGTGRRDGCRWGASRAGDVRRDRPRSAARGRRRRRQGLGWSRSNPGGSGRILAMDRGVAVLALAVVGGGIALQALINAGLGRATGSASRRRPSRSRSGPFCSRRSSP